MTLSTLTSFIPATSRSNASCTPLVGSGFPTAAFWPNAEIATSKIKVVPNINLFISIIPPLRRELSCVNRSRLRNRAASFFCRHILQKGRTVDTGRVADDDKPQVIHIFVCDGLHVL